MRDPARENICSQGDRESFLVYANDFGVSRKGRRLALEISVKKPLDHYRNIGGHGEPHLKQRLQFHSGFVPSHKGLNARARKSFQRKMLWKVHGKTAFNPRNGCADEAGARPCTANRSSLLQRLKTGDDPQSRHDGGRGRGTGAAWFHPPRQRQISSDSL